MKLNTKLNVMQVFDWITIPCDQSVTTVITVCQAMDQRVVGNEEGNHSSQAVIYVSDFPDNNFLQHSCGQEEYFLFQCTDSTLSFANTSLLYKRRFGTLNIFHHIESLIKCGTVDRYVQVCLNILTIQSQKTKSNGFLSSIEFFGGLLHYNNFQCDKDHFMLDGHCYAANAETYLIKTMRASQSNRLWTFLEKFGICHIKLISVHTNRAEWIN